MDRQEPAAPALRIDASLSTSHLAVSDVVCRSHPSGWSAEESDATPRLVVPRSGVFVYGIGRVEFLADASSVFLLDPDAGYRVRHPAAGGDECTVLVPSRQLLLDAFGERGSLDVRGPSPRFRTARLAATTRIQLAVRALRPRAGAPTEPLLAEELACLVLNDLAEQYAPPTGLPGADAQRRYVERARAFLAASPEASHTLDAIGRAARCSPFHLARHFKRLTGVSLHQHQLRLRMALALDRLAGGETDLARLAVDLGFATHSHFTARFRQIFGVSPAAARRVLATRRLAEMRRILTAPPRVSGLSF